MTDRYFRDHPDRDVALCSAATCGDVSAVLHAIRNEPHLVAGQPVIEGAWSHGGRRCGALDSVMECIWLLVQHGARFETLSVSTLDSALKYFPRAAQILFANGADPNVREEGGGTILHRMARIGNRSGASIVLERGADINAQTDDGVTPLDEAIRCEHVRMCRFLHERGAAANLETFDSTGQTAQTAALSHSDHPPTAGREAGEVCWYMQGRLGYLRHHIYGELFFASDALIGDVPRSIEEGAPATFVVARDDFGLHAVDVRIAGC